MDGKQIDAYLFNEMSDAEREGFEDSFFDNDALFYDVVDRENALADAYTKGSLRLSEQARFEKTIAAYPVLRQKVANANVLRSFISSAQPEAKTNALAERSPMLSRLADLFTFKSPAFQFAAIGLIAVLAVSSMFLFVENRRLGSLQQELSEARAREAELATRIENERETAGDLTSDLDAERERVKKLEAEIANLRRTPLNTTAPTHSTAPTIATLILSPVGRRGSPPVVKRLELAPGVLRISMIVHLPDVNDDRVSIRLNGTVISEALTVRTRSGENYVSLTIPSERVKDGVNNLGVFDSKGNQLEEFSFLVNRKK